MRSPSVLRYVPRKQIWLLQHKYRRTGRWKITRTVTRVDLGVDLDPTVLRDHIFGDRHAFVDGDALLDDSVVFHAI